MRYPFRLQNPDLISPFRRDQSAKKFLNDSTGSVLSILFSIAVYFERFLLLRFSKFKWRGKKEKTGAGGHSPFSKSRTRLT